MYLADQILETMESLGKTEKIFKENDLILASKEDRRFFFETLMNPPKPNKALSLAMERYRKEFWTKNVEGNANRFLPTAPMTGLT